MILAKLKKPHLQQLSNPALNLLALVKNEPHTWKSPRARGRAEKHFPVILLLRDVATAVAGWLSEFLTF